MTWLFKMLQSSMQDQVQPFQFHQGPRLPCWDLCNVTEIDPRSILKLYRNLSHTLQSSGLYSLLPYYENHNSNQDNCIQNSKNTSYYGNQCKSILPTIQCRSVFIQKINIQTQKHRDKQAHKHTYTMFYSTTIILNNYLPL